MMNSKKLLKTLLWSLAGFTMVLTGCTKTGKDSSSSNKTSTSNSASNSQSTSTSTSNSGNTSTSTPGPIDPETDTFEVAFNYDARTDYMSIWTDRYVNSTIAPLSENVSGYADGRRTTKLDNTYRWNFAVDANGYIVYASWNTLGGYGSPSDGFYFRSGAWDVASNIGSDNFPVFGIADDFQKWDVDAGASGRHTHFDYVIPEGGFIITGRGEDASYTKFYNLIAGTEYTTDDITAKQNAQGPNSWLENMEKGLFDDYYVFINEDKELEVMLREDAPEPSPAYQCAFEEEPTIKFDAIADVLTHENDTDATVHGVIVSRYEDGVLVIADETGAVLVKDSTLEFVPAKEEKTYLNGQTISVKGKFNKVGGQNTITPTEAPTILSKYWAITAPTVTNITSEDYAIAWNVENQNKVVKVLTISFESTIDNVSTFKDEVGNIYKVKNVTLPEDVKAGAKFDIKGVIQVENNEVVLRVDSVNDVVGYAKVTLEGGVFENTTESVKDFAIGSKVVAIASVPEGQRFVNWTCVEDPDSVVTSEKLEISVVVDVTWKATFTSNATIEVINGTIKDHTETSVELTIGTEVTVIANEPEEGMVFAGWFDVTDNLVSAEKEYTFQLANNTILVAKYESEIPPAPSIEGSIAFDKINEDMTGEGLGLYTDFEIDGKLPNKSPYDSNVYIANNVYNPSATGCWASAIVVDKEGKILTLSYKYFTGHGGSYPGHNKPVSTLNHYPDLLGKDNPAFSVSPDFEPWPAETRNNWRFAVPEGGFVIAVSGRTSTANLLAKILNDNSILEKAATDVLWESYTNDKLMADYSLPENVRLYLSFDNKLVVEHEVGTIVKPININPKNPTDGLTIYSDNYVNGTIAPASPNVYGNAEGKRAFLLDQRDSKQNYVIGVNEQGKIVYASWGLMHGYGSPSDGFYSRVGEERGNNPIFSLADDFGPYPNPNFGKFELVVPTNGFVIVATAEDGKTDASGKGITTDAGMIQIINLLTENNFENELPVGNGLFENNTANGSLDHFTVKLTKMGKISIVDDNAGVEATPEENVVPAKNKYTVFTENSEKAIPSYLDETRTAVCTEDNKTSTYLPTKTDLLIAVDSEGRITYLTLAPSQGYGSALAASYYRNDYYGYGVYEPKEFLKDENGEYVIEPDKYAYCDNKVPLDAATTEGKHNVVNPAFVIDTNSPINQWAAVYTKWQLVVPQGGFVVMANGTAANDFLTKIYNCDPFDLSTETAIHTAAGLVNSNAEFKARVSDDTRLTIDEKLNVTVIPGVKLADITLENVAIQKVNGEAYVEGQNICVGDKVEVMTTLSNEEFLKYQQDGKDVSSYLKTGAPIWRYDVYEFTATEKTTVKAVAKTERAANEFDVMTSLDGYGTYMSVWSEGEVLNAGTTMANAWRTIIVVDENGKITNVSYSVPAEGLTVGKGFVIAAHDETITQFLTYVLEEETKIIETEEVNNRAEVYAKLLAIKDNYTLSVNDGVLTVTKKGDEPTPVPEVADITLENATIATVNGEAYVEGTEIHVGDDVVVTKTLTDDEFFKWTHDGKDVSSYAHRSGALIGRYADYAFKATKTTLVKAEAKKGNAEQGTYDILFGLDGHDHAMAYWAQGTELKYGVNLPTEYRLIIEIDENGKVVEYSYGPGDKESTYTVKNAYAIATYYNTINPMLSNLLGKEVVLDDNNRNAIMDEVMAIRELRLTFANGLLTVNKINLIAEKDFAYELINLQSATDDAKGLFTVWTDLEVAGTIAPVSPNNWGYAEGRRTKLNANAYRYAIAVDKDGYIIYASWQGGSGGPGDGFYSRPGMEKTKNPVFKCGDDFAPWVSGKDNHTHYDFVLPEGGFVVTASDSNAQMLAFVNHITGKELTKLEDNNALFEVQIAKGSLDKWHLSLTETGNIRVQDRNDVVDTPAYVTSTLTVENGTVNGETTAVVETNSFVTVVANAAEEGFVFAGWFENDVLVSSETTYTFKLAKDTTLTAKYESEVTPTPEVAEITLENVTITTVNGEAYVEGTEIHVGDKVVVNTTLSETDFLKYQQDGKDVSSYLKNGAPIWRYAPYEFTATAKTTVSSIQKIELGAGKFDVMTSLDGYGTFMAVWTQGEVLKTNLSGTENVTMGTNYRALFVLDEKGAIIDVLWLASLPNETFTVAEGTTVISAHDVPVAGLLSTLLNEEVTSEQFIAARDTYLARAKEVTGFVLTVENGVLTVMAKEEAGITLKNASIVTVNGKAYTEGTKIYKGDEVVVAKTEGLSFLKWQQDGKDVSSSLKNGAPILRDENYKFIVNGETSIEAVEKVTREAGQFDVTVNLDGYSSLMSVWTVGNSLINNQTIGTQFRTIIKVNDKGLITEVFYNVPEAGIAVESGMVIAAYDKCFESLASFLLGRTVEITYDDQGADAFDRAALYEEIKAAPNTLSLVNGVLVAQPFPEVTIAEALNLVEGTNMIVTGTVIRIEQLWNDSFKNMSVTIAEGDNFETTLYVYRLSTQVEVNDVIKVTGIMSSYNGVKQVAQGATAEITGKGSYVPPTSLASLSFADKANRTSFSTTQQVWEQNGITFTNDKDGSTTSVADYAPVRLYKSSKVTVTYTEAFTKVVFITADGKNFTTESVAGATITVNGSTTTIEFTEAVTTFSFSCANQIRVTEMSIVA